MARERRTQPIRPAPRGRLISIVLALAVAASPGGLFAQARLPATCDILFAGGRIMDGSGNPWFYGDVAVTGGKIAAVGRLAGRITAARTIDVKGRIVAPGFIDIHTHAYDDVRGEATWTGADEARYGAPNYVSQGVTTLIANSCGYGPPSLAGQMDTLRRKGTGPNVLLLIGHNSVRREVMKDDHRRPATDEEVRRMAALVRAAMEEGAAGMSSGLEYVPAIWSTPAEVVALARELAPYGGVFMAHERSAGLTPMWYVPSQDPPGPPTMIDNIEELIAVAETTGVRVVASHIKARGADFWGGSRILIRMIEAARARGADIWADCYPYNTSGTDGSVVLLPDWALGRQPKDGLRAVLADPEKARALEIDVRAAYNWRGGADNIVIMDHPDKSLIGKSVGEVARARGLSDVEMAIRLQMEGYDRRGGARLRSFSMSEDDIEAFYAQPWVATSSDGSIALPADGPVHARFYGTFPRKIRHYAMERRVLTVENAVRTSTSLPAQILGLRDRGFLREGLCADLVVFDPEEIRDTATFFEPHQHAAGVVHVLVNGKFVVEDGRLTGARPGRLIMER